MSKKWLYIISAALFIALLLVTCSKCKNGEGTIVKSDTLIQIDTLTLKYYDTFHTKPVLVRSGNMTDTVYRDRIVEKYSSTNCDTVIQERNELLALYTTQNEYYDGILVIKTDTVTGKKDTLAFVSRIDTIAANQILASSWTTEILQKQINKTVTITNTVSRFQIYLGGEIGGYKQEIFSLAGLGVLFKTKKDNLYGLKATLDLNGQLYYSVQYYKLISFRKKK